MGPPSPLPPLQGAFPHCRSSRGSPSNHGAPEPENGPHGAGAGGGSAPWGAGAGVSTPRRAPQALTRALSSSPDDPEGAFVPPEFDVTGNTFEVSGRRPGGQRGKGCREPAQLPRPGPRLPRLRVRALVSPTAGPERPLPCGGRAQGTVRERGREPGRLAVEAARPARALGAPQSAASGLPHTRRAPGTGSTAPGVVGVQRGHLAAGVCPRCRAGFGPSGQWPPSALYPLTESAGPRALPLAEGPVWAQQAVGRGRHPPPAWMAPCPSVGT